MFSISYHRLIYCVLNLATEEINKETANSTFKMIINMANLNEQNQTKQAPLKQEVKRNNEL
jgi:hypothetical protein